ncbi:transcription termination factor Rho [Brevibacterium ihuae]|uniref:transcription termination factor Rho n=1 Tax=Brevibacterium ihuae TaxID=1631743 RepID=UPI001FEA0158|nr:transcription termination factor Rho [Brevibacterium ihuae]
MTETTNTETAARSGSLTALRLPQLQEMAAGLGIKGYRRLRKSDLIEAINAAGSGAQGSAPAPARRSAGRGRAADAPAAESAPAAPAQGDAAEKSDEAQQRSRRGRGAGEQQAAEAPAAEQQRRDDREPGSGSESQERGGRGGDRAENRNDNRGNDRKDRGGNDNRNDRNDNNRDRNDSRSERGGDNRGDRNDRGNGNGDDRNDRGDNDRNDRGGNDNRDRNENRNDRSNGNDRNDRGGRGRDRGDNRNDRDGDRRGRNRGRDRKRRGRNDFDEPELRPDDVLIPVGGILDVHDNYAFLRTTGYLPGPNDVYVSANMVKRNGLRKGDAIVGAIRQSREGERSGKREKFDALVRLDSVNGLSVEDAKRRVEFSKLTPLYPQERLRMETTSKQISGRIIDLVSPIGKGQRGLIVAPPKAGKTMIMQQIANAITANNPSVHLMVVLVDERPEEVTDMERAVQGEVIASTFDRPADDHTTIAELAIERAKRLVEMGQDVVVLLDNITRLGRAYNLAQPASGRILSGGVDANALYPPKKFFGAARNIEGGGSLTILATALVETGSRMDEVIFEEFKGTGNMELRLSRNLADKRIYPAVDVNSSGTRREENLMSPEETKVMWKLRRVLSGLEQQQALELLLSKLKETGSNAEFLMQVQKTTPLPKSAADEY